MNVNGETTENRDVAIAITGLRALPFWNGGEREAKFDTFDLKGIIEEFLEQFGLRGIAFGRRRKARRRFWNPPP